MTDQPKQEVERCEVMSKYIPEPFPGLPRISTVDWHGVVSIDHVDDLVCIRSGQSGQSIDLTQYEWFALLNFIRCTEVLR